MGNTQELWSHDKGHSENKDLRSIPYQTSEGTRDSHSGHMGRVHSLTHCTRKSADWLLLKSGLKASPETPLPGVILKTSYRHLI